MLVFSVLTFSTAVILAAIYARSRKAGIFDPVTLFLGFYALWVLPLPLRLCFTQEVAGDISDQLPMFAPYVPWAVLLCADGIPVFLWAYYSAFNKTIASRIPIPGEPERAKFFKPFFSFDKTRLAAASICAFSLFLVSLLVQGGILAFLLLGYDSTQAMIGKGYLAAGIPWFFVGSMLFLYRYAAKKSKLDILIFGVLLVLQIGAMFLLGDRHSILNYALVVLIFWNFAVRKIKVKRLAVLLIALYLALNLIGYLRQSNYDSLGAFVDSTKESASQTDKEGAFYTVTSGEFVVAFESLPQIIRKFPSEQVPCRWGSTYLLAPLQFIPSVLFEKRPDPLANWYMTTFYGRGGFRNEGRQFFFLAEGYLNFGPIGVFLAMAFWGFALGVLNCYLKLNAGNHGAVLIYAICLAFLPRCIYADSIAPLVALPEQFLLIAIIGLWFSGGFKRLTVPQTKPRSLLASPQSAS